MVTIYYLPHWAVELLFLFVVLMVFEIRGECEDLGDSLTALYHVAMDMGRPLNGEFPPKVGCRSRSDLLAPIWTTVPRGSISPPCESGVHIAVVLESCPPQSNVTVRDIASPLFIHMDMNGEGQTRGTLQNSRTAGPMAGNQGSRSARDKVHRVRLLPSELPRPPALQSGVAMAQMACKRNQGIDGSNTPSSHAKVLAVQSWWVERAAVR
jgi:hypothetical protein